MYVAPHQLTDTSLLQGDVVGNIQLLGAIHLLSIQQQVPITGNADPTAWTVTAPPKIGHAMVLSHSCEIALDNEIKVTSVILAPLRDVDTTTSQEKLEELITSNLIDDASQASYLKYFYLEPAAGIPFPNGAVADFSKCFSVRNKSYGTLLDNKILQLEDEIRMLMSLKLALYFHRDHQDAA